MNENYTYDPADLAITQDGDFVAFGEGDSPSRNPILGTGRGHQRYIPVLTAEQVKESQRPMRPHYKDVAAGAQEALANAVVAGRITVPKDKYEFPLKWKSAEFAAAVKASDMSANGDPVKGK